MRLPGLLPLVTLCACNDGGLTSHNTPPKARITSPAKGEAVGEGRLVTLRGTAADPNDRTETLTARWFLDDAEACPGSGVNSDGSVRCSIIAPGSAFEIELEVRDPRGEVGVARRTIDVLPDAPPSARITRPLEGQGAYADTLLTVAGIVGDPEDAATDLTVWWELGTGGPLDIATALSSDGSVETFLELEAGEHAIFLHVEDTVGGRASDSVRVRVSSTNRPPDCRIDAPTGDGPGAEGRDLPMVAEVDDPDEWPRYLDVAWSSDIDGDLGGSAPDDDGVATHTTALSRGTHQLTLTVTDSGGLTCEDTTIWRVEAPPVITIDTPTDGATVGELSEVAFQATVSDAEDAPDALTVTWSSDTAGTLHTEPPAADGTSRFSQFGMAPGPHAVTATVTDSAGLSTSASIGIDVDGAPGAPGVSLSPTNPTTTDDLVATIHTPATDPEGDTLTYRYRWAVGGVLTSASTTATLPAAATTKGEVWTVHVNAHDGTAEGNAGSDSVTILNTPPTATAATITPDPAVTGDTLTCVLSGFSDADADADASTFAWDVGGAAVGTGPTLSGGFSEGDTVTCTATPHDGTDAGPPHTDSVLIGNGRPAVTHVSLTPSTARTDDTLSASVVYADPEGDAVTLAYAWTVAGASVGATGATLDGTTWFDKSERVSVTVTPSDAGGAGTPGTASTTIANSPPTAPAVSIAPVGPAEGDDLVCTVDTPSTDADGDSVTYSVAWTVDAVAYPRGADVGPATTTWTDDTADGVDNLTGELWACAVTPDDGTDTGTAGTASETILAAETRVFVTSATWSGNLSGTSGADQHCQDAADAQGLGGTWAAWVSSTSRSARDQVGVGPYVLLDGTVIATDLADLTDGSLAHAIDMDETGAPHAGWVFTGSDDTGTRGTNTSTNGLCTDWTRGCGVCYGNHFYGNAGRSDRTSGSWTNQGWLFCSTAASLYCFEQ